MKKQKESLIEDLYTFLKILAENSRGHIKREEDWKNHIKRSEKKLAKIFGRERLENLIDLCFEQGYIRRERVKGIPKKKGFEEDFYSIRIQGKGLRYLEEFEREEKKLKISIGMLITTGALVLITLSALVTTIFFSSMSLKTQINLANQNIEFLKQTSSTNWANVEIDLGGPNQEAFVISAERLANPNIERYPLNLVIINSGKINTGKISLNPLSDKIIYTKIEPNNDINLSSQSGKEAIISLSQRECTLGLEEKCNPKIIPKEYNLTLMFSCQFCQPDQRIFNITVPLCIFHNEEEREYCNEKY